MTINKKVPNLTAQELATMREMGYSIKDIERLIKDRDTWHISKKEAFDEVVAAPVEDVESELNFDR